MVVGTISAVRDQAPIAADTWRAVAVVATIVVAPRQEIALPHWIAAVAPAVAMRVVAVRKPVAMLRVMNPHHVRVPVHPAAVPRPEIVLPFASPPNPAVVST